MLAENWRTAMVKVPEGYRSENVQDRRSGGSGRGAADLLGGMMGGNATGGGLLGSLLGSGAGMSILGSVAGALLGGGRSGGGLGSILGSMLGGGGSSSAPAVSAEQRQAADDDAEILIRAMCNAAKADGEIDQSEIDAIVGRLGEVDEHEAAFLRAELQAPVDLEAFCRSVPAELTQQAYAFSLLGMKLDTQQEASYLGAVAQGLRLDGDTCNAIHDKLQAPRIFR
jgi:uncharacterized membrane protein YebE (DUF533 family)